MKQFFQNNGIIVLEMYKEDKFYGKIQMQCVWLHI